MGRFALRRLPSPAMAVAFVALLAALSGTAIALPGKNTVDSGDIKRGAVKNRDIAAGAVTGSKVRNRTLTGAKVTDNSLTGADINESTLSKVPSAGNADNANTAVNANRAASAAQADIGLSPVAYARVLSTGDVVEADSRGVADANVTLESTSAYCFRGLPFAFKTAMAVADYGDAGTTVGSGVQVAKGDPFDDCAGDPQLLVAGVTSNDGAGLADYATTGFYVWFYN